jgi:hypothetical protein
VRSPTLNHFETYVSYPTGDINPIVYSTLQIVQYWGWLAMNASIYSSHKKKYLETMRREDLPAEAMLL